MNIESDRITFPNKSGAIALEFFKLDLANPTQLTKPDLTKSLVLPN